LLQAQSRVEELTCANRRKDEFLAMLSHELSSPLSAIHHAARYLGRPSGEAAVQQRMQAIIERQLTRMTHLVQELRDVSLIASGKLHLQRERVDLRDIVRHTVETLEWEIQKRNHRLAIDLPGGPVWLRAAARRLEQVFVNLLANASRYTDDGGELAVWVQAKDGEVIVQVRDSGIGIAPESMPQIFDLFKQGNAADLVLVPGSAWGSPSCAISSSCIGAAWSLRASESVRGASLRFVCRQQSDRRADSRRVARSEGDCREGEGAWHSRHCS